MAPQKAFKSLPGQQFDLKQMVENWPGLNGMDLASKVSTGEVYRWDIGVFNLSTNSFPAADTRTTKHKVVAVDYGCKKNILRCLVEAGCDVELVPATTTAAELSAAGRNFLGERAWRSSRDSCLR